MRAAQINQYGHSEVLKTAEDAPRPPVDKGRVVVEVHAAAINPFDRIVREGQARQMAELSFPATLGGDFAGVVAELGEAVSGLSVGEAVYGQAGALSGQGSFAEFTVASATSMASMPKSVDFKTAAAVPLAGTSAYQALIEHAKLQQGQKILIHGGAGGIGSFAIQLAKHLGAYVAATAAAEDIDFVKDLGADEVIDYKSQDFTSLIHDFDMVYDTVGGDTYAKSFQVLKKGGLIVSMLAQPNEELMRQYGVQSIYQFTKVTSEKLDALAAMIDEGTLKVFVDKVFPLEQAAEAMAYLESGKHHGKVVLEIK